MKLCLISMIRGLGEGRSLRLLGRPLLLGMQPWLSGILIAVAVIAGIFLLSVLIYWFNLDNKLIYKFVYPLLQKHYDRLKRDRRI